MTKMLFQFLIALVLFIAAIIALGYLNGLDRKPRDWRIEAKKIVTITVALLLGFLAVYVAAI
ncbi:MAG: hypothetical protein A2846_01900 [Candidatus Doudnabacteria bacterium RIFCSPHIGHO2_01_FULL_49_9]|uniref:HIG1 domain-containing protein n=1 Tax=Candidatus Doudnabacteria bacterium RIFCSPHIGHO2_01_FULL_49_9 TaxID=1817827 RepID=A0A1F5P2P4_9BACT|nr:MAG: hypothetical protein A2846_01900 [Candidatus Doudnabacteria bacterium RIFCSPHIGHO2_01_FULL_49_9]